MLEMASEDDEDFSDDDDDYEMDDVAKDEQESPVAGTELHSIHEEVHIFGANVQDRMDKKAVSF